jgi:hypothetical protein
MDQHLSWAQLSLPQQLNCVCNTLAKQAVMTAIIKRYHYRPTQILLREDVTLIVWGDKITGNILGPLRFHASKPVTCKYLTHQRKKNKWTHNQFEEVDWEHLDLALKLKLDNCRIWQSKQTSGFCGAQLQVRLYSGEAYLDERCPNCSAQETNTHLMRCPYKDRTCLLIDNLDKLEKWMETDDKTDPELIYWILKYILMRNDKQFAQLGHMSQKMHALAESQDKIGWRNFTDGYISMHFYSIQHFYLLLSGNYLNRADWTRQFINKILQLTRLQWIYRKISLHDKRQGYLHNKQLEDLLREILNLSDLSPKDVLESCKFY